jgi:hypothetical protein
MGIAVAAASAVRYLDPLIGFREIMKNFARLVVRYNSPNGDLDFQILTISAALVTSLPVLASCSTKNVVVSESQQRVFLGIRDEVHTASVAAVTTTWPATWDKLLAPKGYAAMASVAGFDRDFGLINKHDGERSGNPTGLSKPVGRFIRQVGC